MKNAIYTLCNIKQIISTQMKETERSYSHTLG